MELTRREFLEISLKLSAIAGTGVALGGCGLPVQSALVSQLKMPEYRLPGEPRWFATTCGDCGAGCGVAVKIIEGRAKKIEGLPTHPISRGKVCSQGHSALQDLYNPDRLPGPLGRQGDKLAPLKDWKEAVTLLGKQLQKGMEKPGATLWVTGPLRGTTGALVAAIAQKVGARIWVLDFPGLQSERAAMKALTGHANLPDLSLQDSDFVVNFGGDFLGAGCSPVRDNWAYGEFRQGKGRNIVLLLSLSPRLSLTSANSDQWIPVRPGSEGWIALGVGNLLSKSKRTPWPEWAGRVSLKTISQVSGVSEERIRKLARKIEAAEKPLVVGGFDSAACTNGVWSQWVIQSLNRLLSGRVNACEPDLLVPLSIEEKIPSNLLISGRAALDGLKRGAFHTVWFLGANPLYLLPKDLEMEKAMEKIESCAAFTPCLNETAAKVELVLPTVSWLEEWGDQRIVLSQGGGLYCLRQPVVMERSGGKSLAEILLSAISGQAILKGKSLYDLLRSRFTTLEWETALTRGGLWDEAPLDWEHYGVAPLYPPPPVPLRKRLPKGLNPWDGLPAVSFKEARKAAFSGEGKVLIPYPSLTLGDGSLANRPWMQELPDPMVTTLWTHWVELHDSVAEESGIERGDVVRIVSEAGSIEAPAFPSPGIHPDCIAVPVGQGHTSYGRYAQRGANPLTLLKSQWQEGTGEPAWISTRVRIEKTGKKQRMSTMDHRVSLLERRVLPE
ncbi:MAG: hypothetical protein HYU64_20245 [Armatimonadetes bacterium]|nr:hypothetical protein [Armatimonadota bacterium]